MKPIVKWAGGKTWLVPKLLKEFELHKNRLPQERQGYAHVMELFAGGAALTFALPRNMSSTLVDVNEGLMELYRRVAMLRMDNSFLEHYPAFIDASLFAALRDEYNTTTDTRRRALLFLVMMKYGFNGLYRENAAGKFNVPWNKKPYVPHGITREHVARLGNTLVLTCDYKRAIRAAHYGNSLSPETFVFADPPYHGTFTGYSANGFKWDDQVELAHVLRAMHGNMGCTVVATNSDAPPVLELYRDLGFGIEMVNAPRRISCNGDRRQVQEMYATLRGQ